MSSKLSLDQLAEPLSKGTSKRKRRIVPEEQRKRIAVSCDRCRKRKLRCRVSEAPKEIQSNGDSSKPLSQPNENETCTECLKAGISCTRELPRKKRVYGSVETLSLHYQALLLVIRDLYPDRDCETLGGILDIAKERNIEIPENLEPEGVPETAFLKQPSKSPSGSASEAFNSSVTSNGTDAVFSYPADSRPAVPSVKSEVSAERKPLPDLGSERLVYDRAGLPYYVGSSGSMAFFHSLCKIIGKKNENQTRESRVAPLGEKAAASSDSIAAKYESTRQRREKQDDVYFYTMSSSPTISDSMPSLPDGDQLSFLPPKEECDIYVETFLRNVNPSFPLFRIKPFKEKYEQYWSDIQGSQHRKTKWENQIDWRCCLYMVIVMGSRALIDSKESSRRYGPLCRYASVVQGALSILAVTTTVESIQTLFLLSLYFYGVNERNASWLVVGMACRQAMALGFHRETATASCTPDEAQQRRQMWYSLYSFEVTLCSNLGRPICVRYDGIDVTPPNEVDEDLSLYYAPGCVDTNCRMLKLFIQVMINMHLGEWKGLLAPSNISSTLESSRLLKDFLVTLPPHLREITPALSDYHARAILRIHMRVNYTISILCRPIVLYMAGADPAQISPQNLQGIVMILNIASASTVAISQIFMALNERKLINGVYETDIFYGYCACLVLSLLSVIMSSGKYDHCGLAYTKSEINSSLSAIVKVMDSNYLEGTMYRLARVTASILTGLGIKLSYENPDFPAKGNSFEPGSAGFSDVSENLPIPPKLPPSNATIPLTFVEEYERVFMPQNVPFTSPDDPNLPKFSQHQSEMTQVNLDDLDLFTEAFNASFYDVSNTFNFSNVIFPPAMPENGADEFSMRPSYPPLPNNAVSIPQTYFIPKEPDSNQPIVSSSNETILPDAAPTSPNKRVLPMDNNIYLGSKAYLDALYNPGEVGAISNMTWMSEDHGKSQLMDYVNQKANRQK